ncbi:MAG: response regulator [Dehalococcoidia bacterium]
MTYSGNDRGLRYIRVANEIREAILGGKYPPGTQLPSQHKTAAQYGVAFNTLRQALDLLEDEGYVLRRLGRGTYTAVPSLVKGSVLVVDDDVYIGGLFTRVISADDYELVTVTSGEDALALLAQRDFDLVFLDLVMPGMDGPETLARMRAAGYDVPVVIITAYPEPDLLVKVLELGPTPLLRKPFTADQILSAIQRFARSKQQTSRRASR